MSEYIIEVTDGWKPVECTEEIVRCRDCRKWDFMHQDSDGTEWGECSEFSHSCGGHFTRMNGFCYWGERRNESLVEFIEREGRKRDTND